MVKQWKHMETHGKWVINAWKLQVINVWKRVGNAWKQVINECLTREDAWKRNLNAWERIVNKKTGIKHVSLFTIRSCIYFSLPCVDSWLVYHFRVNVYLLSLYMLKSIFVRVIHVRKFLNLTSLTRKREIRIENNNRINKRWRNFINESRKLWNAKLLVGYRIQNVSRILAGPCFYNNLVY